MEIASQSAKVDPQQLLSHGFIEVARVSDGCTLGALALVDNRNRPCSAKCLEDTVFLVLTKNEYERSLREIDKRQEQKKVNFVKNIPLFSKLTTTYLKNKLSVNFKHLECTKDHILFREGDPAERVFIVRQGEFVETVKFPVREDKEENVHSIHRDPKRACKLKNQFFVKNIVKKMDHHVIGYIGQGNMIGERDIVLSEFYTSTVKCISQKAQLYYILKEDFMKLQSQQTTWSILEDMIEGKKNKNNSYLSNTIRTRQRVNAAMVSSLQSEQQQQPAEPPKPPKDQSPERLLPPSRLSIMSSSMIGKTNKPSNVSSLHETPLMKGPLSSYYPTIPSSGKHTNVKSFGVNSSMMAWSVNQTRCKTANHTSNRHTVK